LQGVFDRYTGAIEQVPPMVSAVKIGGQRLYKMARKGHEVEREPRPVMVHEFSLLAYNAPDAQIRVRCSRGTYVRSLCHDVGQALGCGGVLAELRRTQVGRHRIEDAAALDDLATPEDVRRRLLSVDDVLDLPEVRVADSSRRIVESGGMLYPMHLAQKCPVDTGWVQIKTESGALLALGEAQVAGADRVVQPKRVFAGPA
jgi:tRNA pseudouridine55 synthase